MIEIKPVKKYDKPKYPDREQVSSNPEILRYIPRRWAVNPIVMTALGLTITLSGCVRSMSEKGNYAVAPVFEHGQGRGTYGCVAVVAPYFFSEEEALEIIRNEAESYGRLSFDTEITPDIENVTINAPYVIKSPVGESERKRTTIKVTTDGWNKDHNIAFEFVSTEDLWNWMWEPKDNEKATWSTITSLRVKETAEDLNAALCNDPPDMNNGVFYDPYSYDAIKDIHEAIEKKYKTESDDWDYDAILEETWEQAHIISEENLRAQVRDFIDWLKAQGII